MDYLKLSTGNEMVDNVSEINFTGNIVPSMWYKTITRDNGKPYLTAIVILADIVYWYRWSEVRDTVSGGLLGVKKKFKEDILQRSYQQLADMFGISKREATAATTFLERLGVIKRDYRKIKSRG